MQELSERSIARNKKSYRLRYPQKRRNSGESWAKIRQRVIYRDGHTCTYCGCDVFVNAENQRFSLVIEHMYTRDETMDNLCVSCRRCNSQKNSKTFPEWLQNIERKLLTEDSQYEIDRYLKQVEFITSLDIMSKEDS